jgi:hypothetical protein
VTIRGAMAGATIHYTTNGTTPTTLSTIYSGPIQVSATETIQAIAVATGYTNSSVAMAAYTINPVLPAPTFSPVAGTYNASQSVTIRDAMAGTTIYYTTNGTTPTTASAKYAGAITVSGTETIQAIAAATGYTSSSVSTATYIINSVLPAPTFSPAAGTYSASQSVTIRDAMAGATIHYTTNGTTPTTSSTIYSGPIQVSTTETIKAIAVETGYSPSAVASATYTLPGNSTLPASFNVALSPASLSLAAGQSATTTVRVDPVNGFNQAVSFGCTGLPAALSCAFSPSSVTTNGASATATLTVSANASVAARSGTLPLIPVAAWAFVFCAIGLRGRFRFALFIAVAVLGLTALNGCSDPKPITLVPATSTITVTATSGAIQQATALTVALN